MLHKVVIGAIMGTICAVSGYLIASEIPQFGQFWWAGWVGGAAGLAVAFVTLALEQVIKRIPLKTILGSTLGLFVGLGIGKLASYPFDKYLELPNLQIPLYIFLSAIFGYIGLVLGGKKMSEISTPYFLDPVNKPSRLALKILDTSVIIDGRIADIAETGFVEGTLVVPKFILEELQYIADSADDLRRTRGRRGLDILKRLQQQNPLRVEFTEDDIPTAAGADSKLVALG
ncbi:MAG: PIN domain nuclease, partial [Deltaproteobacteria bacterium]|nr:PIN domain nuclease [Deltaproteobacteria bacterium]